MYILENDDKTNRKGLVEEVAGMRIQLDDLITKDKVLAGKMTVLGFIGGGGCASNTSLGYAVGRGGKGGDGLVVIISF